MTTPTPEIPPKPTSVAEWTLVDADLARKWLAGNSLETNRPPRQPWHETMAQDMVVGKFDPNAETVKLTAPTPEAPDGVVVDGQNRLFAVLDADKIKPGVKVWILVAFGVPLAYQGTVDIGRSRSLADLLHLEYKVGHPEAVAATAMKLYAWDGGARWFGPGGAKVRPSKPQLKDYFIANSTEIIHATTSAVGVRRELRLQGAIVAMAYAVFARMDPECAQEYFKTLRTGHPNYGAEDPAYQVRERLKKDREKGSIPPYETLYWLFTGWNQKGRGKRTSAVIMPKNGLTPLNFPELEKPRRDRWMLGGSPLAVAPAEEGTLFPAGDHR